MRKEPDNQPESSGKALAKIARKTAAAASTFRGDNEDSYNSDSDPAYHFFYFVQDRLEARLAEVCAASAANHLRYRRSWWTKILRESPLCCPSILCGAGRASLTRGGYSYAFRIGSNFPEELELHHEIRKIGTAWQVSSRLMATMPSTFTLQSHCRHHLFLECSGIDPETVLVLLTTTWILGWFYRTGTEAACPF